MIDMMSVPLPIEHTWAIVLGWVAAYCAGRFIVAGR